MGLELTGTATFTPTSGTAQRGTTKLHLDGEELQLRGEVKLRVPRSAIRDITTRAGTVTITTTLGVLKATLGETAEKFAKKLAEAPKSRLEKMGITAGSTVTLLNLRDAGLDAELASLGATVRGTLAKGAELIVLGVESAADLARIAKVAKAMAPTGALWVIHPKGVAGVKDTDIFAAGKAAGLTNTKVAKYSATHTGEKLVVPVAARG